MNSKIDDPSLRAFCQFAGQQPIEDDHGWSYEVWKHAVAWCATEEGRKYINNKENTPCSE